MPIYSLHPTKALLQCIPFVWLFDNEPTLIYEAKHLILIPRHYPERFADSVVRMRKSFFDKCSNNRRQQVPVPESLPSSVEILDATREDDGGLFGFADLKAAYQYIRAAKGLQLPNDWRKPGMNLLPHDLPERVPLISRGSSSFLMEE